MNIPENRFSRDEAHISVYGPAPKMLVLLTYLQKTPLLAEADVSRGARERERKKDGPEV